MRTQWRVIAIGGMVLAGGIAVAQQTRAGPAPGADEIMSRVAANQEKAEQARAHYVYVQHARVVSRKGKTLMCEELTDSRIAPSGNGSHAELLKLQGQVLHKHGYVKYSWLLPDEISKQQGEQAQPKEEGNHNAVTLNLDDQDMDREIVEDLLGDLTRSDSKDGIDERLFPLTSKSQGNYAFRLTGQERMNGRDVYHLEFRPKTKDSSEWKGDAYVDKETYQPVVVSTEMARKVPFAVRTLLGTSVPGLGFSITYAPQPDGVWFPVSFGTEFKLHVLFFFSREIIIDAHNGDFEKTHVTSRIIENQKPQ